MNHPNTFARRRRFELAFHVAVRLRAGTCLPLRRHVSGRSTSTDLNERARNNYFFARAVVGREFSFPVVRRGRCIEIQRSSAPLAR